MAKPILIGVFGFHFLNKIILILENHVHQGQKTYIETNSIY